MVGSTAGVAVASLSWADCASFAAGGAGVDGWLPPADAVTAGISVGLGAVVVAGASIGASVVAGASGAAGMAGNGAVVAAGALLDGAAAGPQAANIVARTSMAGSRR